MLDNCLPPDWRHNSPEQLWSHEGGDVDTSETFRLGRSLKKRKKMNHNLTHRLKVDIEHSFPRLPERVQDGGELDASSAHDRDRRNWTRV